MLVAEKDGTPDSSIGYLRDDWDVFIQLSEKKNVTLVFINPNCQTELFVAKWNLVVVT